MSVIGALVSLLRGKQFYYDDLAPSVDQAASVPGAKTLSPNGPGPSSPAGDSPDGADGAPAVLRQDSAPAPRSRGA
jgi:hypothetical protein